MTTLCTRNNGIKRAASRLSRVYYNGNDRDYIEADLQRAGRRWRFRERDLARQGQREKLKQQLSDSLDALCFGESDIAVNRLPHSAATPKMVEVRDAIKSIAELYSTDELAVANLLLKGYSPHATFEALGVANATGYRKYGPVIRQLREACHG